MLFCRPKTARKSIKKSLKIVLTILFVILLIITGLYITVQSRGFQNWLIGRITTSISERTGASISIGHVNIALFDRIVFEDVLMGDSKNDTLLYIGQAIANVDSIAIFKKRVHLKNIDLVRPRIDIKKLDSLNFNFTFLMNMKRDTTSKSPQWQVHCETFRLKKGEFNYAGLDPIDPVQNWSFNDFNVTINGVSFPRFDDFAFTLNNFNFKDDNGLHLRNLSLSVWGNDSLLTVKNLKLRTEASNLTIDSLGVNMRDYKQTRDIRNTRFTLMMPEMHLQLSDLSHFIPEFAGSQLYTDISIHLNGRISSLKSKAFKARLGDITNLSGEFYINGLPDLEQTYIFLNLNESYANLHRLRNIDFPTEIWDVRASIPEFLSNIGALTYQGNFTGFMNDFVTYGTAYSELGIIRADLSIKPVQAGTVQLKGNVNTSDLNIGEIFGNKLIGMVSMKGDVRGTLRNYSIFDLTVNGGFNRFDFKEYSYTNVTVNGNMKNNLFNGQLKVNDPNLKMNYYGRLDLSSKIPIFDFATDVQHANLMPLNFLNDSLSKLAFVMKANFEGKNIDNMQGKIDVSNLAFRNKNDSLFLQNAQLTNDTLNSNRQLVFKSDIADVTVFGNYEFSTIATSFMKLFYNYLPSSSRTDSTQIKTNQPLFVDQNNFEFSIETHNLNELTKVFYPKLEIKSPFKISGLYRPQEKSMLIEGVIPEITYEKKNMKTVRIRAGANGNEIFCRIKSDQVQLLESFVLHNLTFDTHGSLDLLKANLYWNNYEEVSYSGSIETETRFSKETGKKPKLDILLLPSKIFIADSLWTVSETKIAIDSTAIDIELFELTNQTQRFMVDGKISRNKEDLFSLIIDDVDFSFFKPLLNGINLNGTINGKIQVSDVYKRPKLGIDLNIKSFDYGSGPIGDVFATSVWNDLTNRIDSKITLTDGATTLLNGEGWIDAMRSEVDVLFNFDNTPLSILQTILPDEFYNQDGKANGQIRASGKLKHLNLDGSVTPNGMASIGLTYLKTTYYTKDRVDFKGDKIVFPNMSFVDEHGNKGTFNGSIKHQSFFKMEYDLGITANKLNVLNTTVRDNSAFYGTAFASGTAFLRGYGENILLSGQVKSERGTSLNIPFESTNEAIEHSFIDFIDRSKSEPEMAPYKVVTTGFNMEFDVEMTPEAKVQIIFNSQIGDIIKGEGSGDLQIKIDKNFNIEMYGDYNIDKGDYLFTFQNLINKRFDIEKGGDIKWVGDPYNALLDITAVYKVKTSLNDLFAESSFNADLSRRMPVDCIIKLDESLLQPRIKFDIQFPSAEKWITDQVNQLIVTEEDLNKQMISLLLLGRFYTPEIITGTNSGTATTGRDLVGTTASELFSNQLSNWLSKINDSWDLGVRYRPGNELSTEQLEVALSTQIFNNRVTINGNVANNADRRTNNTNELVHDFDVNIKLTENGKLQFKFYSRANDNLIYDTEPYTQGAGFTYKEEFNTFSELIKRYKEALSGETRKKKKIKRAANSEE